PNLVLVAVNDGDHVRLGQQVPAGALVVLRHDGQSLPGSEAGVVGAVGQGRVTVGDAHDVTAAVPHRVVVEAAGRRRDGRAADELPTVRLVAEVGRLVTAEPRELEHRPAGAAGDRHDDPRLARLLLVHHDGELPA